MKKTFVRLAGKSIKVPNAYINIDLDNLPKRSKSTDYYKEKNKIERKKLKYEYGKN